MKKVESQDLFEPNDMLDIYCIESSLVIKTKNFVYKAFIPGELKEYYAVKAFPYQTEKDIQNFTRENEVISKLAGQSFILPIIKQIPHKIPCEEIKENGEVVEQELSFICTVTKFCENLDLRDVYLRNILNASNDEAMQMKKFVFFQSLQILDCLQENNIVHHDIKLQNFLVKNLNPIELILIDFEFAYQLENDEKSIRYCGTRPYMAPEILKEQPHDISVDIWSLGVMIYLIYNKCFPFGVVGKDGKKTIYKKITHNQIQFNPDVPDEVKQILTEMLQINPEKRIKPKNAIESPFFNDIRNLLPIYLETKAAVQNMSQLQIELNDAEKIEKETNSGGV